MNKRRRGAFLNDGSVVSYKRIKSRKQKQKQENAIISSAMTSKILKEAQNQQKEIDQEEHTNFFTHKNEEETYEEDVDDDFGAFLEMHKVDGANKLMNGMISEYEKENENLLDRFLSKEDELPDLILEKIKKKDCNVTSADARPLIQMDTQYIEIFKKVAQFMKTYTAGKITKPFKFIPSMAQWEDALKLTEPENWSPHAMYEATRILASNLNPKDTERFYKFVLLPRVRQDLRKNKRLHFALYQSLKKSVYKPAAFFKGILLALCQSGTCNLKEAVVVGSIITKVRIPVDHAGAAIMVLAKMEFSGTTSFFIKLLLEKKFALQYRVIEDLVAHFMRSLEDPKIMPVIWHQTLLAFAQRYKNALLKEDIDKLINLLDAQNHHEVTPEIRRELLHSRNHREEEDAIHSCLSLFNRPVTEDIFDIPEVPMEDD